MTRHQKSTTEFLADLRFHQSLLIAPEKCRDRATRSSPLRVAYSDIGDSEGTPLLFVGGLFGTRYTLALADKLSKERHVRLISPDKPGIGGTDAVDVEQKVGVWLVEALTEQLDLTHISLIAHSSGAIYALNTVLHLRHLLRPRHPYVALVAPWVHPSDSHTFQATVASALPDWAVHRYTARPGVEMKDTDALTKAIDTKMLEYAPRENIEGVSQEALFCLRRGSKQIWGGWEDYDGFLSLLRESEAKLLERRGDKLTVDVYFAESDNSSGSRGSEWFDACWKTHATDFTNYKSRTAPGTTHETVMRPEFEVLDNVFRELSLPSSISA
ncbi:hypothetical protein DL770_006975 [Monosporascus sp. CRB-9-2]|nr:hypothetical protein DL770_006975 [Monosporascus sp. CRB-9-2]